MSVSSYIAAAFGCAAMVTAVVLSATGDAALAEKALALAGSMGAYLVGLHTDLGSDEPEAP